MKMRFMVLLVALAIGLPAFSLAETTECTVIDSLPSVITQQGVYCLKSNLVTSEATGIAIDIQTNNVTIDFNGFKLGNLGAGSSTNMYGVYANERSNIIIKNAVIRGFMYGVKIEGGSGHVVSGNTFDTNSLSAIYVSGYSIIENNNVINTGGRNVSSVYAIQVNGIYSRSTIVRNNVVRGFNNSSGSWAFGIYIVSSKYVTVENNIIIGYGDPLVEDIGVYSNGSTNSTFDRNKLFGVDYAIGSVDYSTVIASNNIFNNCTQTKYIGAYGSITDAGGNYPAL